MGQGANYWTTVETAVGRFAVVGDSEVVTEVVLPNVLMGDLGRPTPSEPVRLAAEQIAEYVEGERLDFDIPMRSGGTSFQEQVWAALDEIPYGEVRSYAWVADAVGRPHGPRAVGQALGRNPIPILRACHRVVATDGIGGYGGGIGLKRSLLEIEGVEFS